MIEFDKFTLKNNLTVIVHKDVSTPLACLKDKDCRRRSKNIFRRILERKGYLLNSDFSKGNKFCDNVTEGVLHKNDIVPPGEKTTS